VEGVAGVVQLPHIHRPVPLRHHRPQHRLKV
jgi:hypothetical protein